VNEKSNVSLLDAPCQFGGVSIGDQTARLGITIPRSSLAIDHADEYFSGRRLSCRVALGRVDESPEQMKLIDDCDFVVTSVCDVKGFRVTSDNVSFGLTFNLKETDIQTLAKFSKGSGRFSIEDVGEIPEAEIMGTDEADETESGTFTTEKHWREVQLTELFHGAILKSLNQAGLSTIGHLSDYNKDGQKFFTDIKGIGKAAAEKIENRMVEFWRDNPGAE